MRASRSLFVRCEVALRRVGPLDRRYCSRVKDILNAGWRPLRLLAGVAVGLAIAAVVVVLFGQGGASVVGVVSRVVLALLVVAYLGSVVYTRFTEKWRAAWAARRAEQPPREQ
jgi:hypothetical protein